MLNRQQNQKKRDRKSKSACSHANASNQMSTSDSHSWQIYLFSMREHFGIIHACMYGNPFVPSATVVIVAVTAYAAVIVVVGAVSALLFILSFNKMTWAYFHFFYRFLVDYYNAIDLGEKNVYWQRLFMFQMWWTSLSFVWKCVWYRRIRYCCWICASCVSLCSMSKRQSFPR